MKLVFKLFILVISVLSFSSCAVHNGYMTNSASLSQANFSYVKKSVSGEASTMKVFGLGGLAKSKIVEEAKKQMLKRNKLQDNQALANVTVNWKNSVYLVVNINTCTVTADIVEFK